MQKYHFVSTNKNCLNSSSSKQLYSFSKDMRFRHINHKLKSSSQYILPTGFASKPVTGPSFPRSVKTFKFKNEEEHKNFPSPTSYNQVVVKKSIGFTMGIKLKSLDRQVKQASPQSYRSVSFKALQSSRSIKFSKSKRNLDIPQKQITPGPYLINNDRLKNILSNFKSPKGLKMMKKIEPLKAIKTIESKLQTIKGQNNKSSIQIESNVESFLGNSFKFRNQSGFAIPKQRRKSSLESKQKTPGPADYEKFSEFGEREKLTAAKKQIKKRSKTLGIQKKVY